VFDPSAVAAGMMVAASYSLIWEGCEFSDEAHDNSEFSSTVRTAFGVFLGLAFILCTKQFLDAHEDLKVGELSAADARKVILIMFVMTLHSFSEGVGIGVSFGGSHGKELGMFISASLAVHNIPEGLAVAIVLLPRKMSKINISLWCIMTSIPQPLMAVPAYLFVHKFIPVLPVGLGFAGGAMAWVAFAELLMEAFEDTDSVAVTGLISTTSLGIMLALQGLMHD
jgi:ZIP family zinc transporter